MFAELLQSPYFALFVIIALGFMLGRIKIRGLSLDISAVIFVALAFGHFGLADMVEQRLMQRLFGLGLALHYFCMESLHGFLFYKK